MNVAWDSLMDYQLSHSVINVDFELGVSGRRQKRDQYYQPPPMPECNCKMPDCNTPGPAVNSNDLTVFKPEFQGPAGMKGEDGSESKVEMSL